jgi:serine/threonine protein kinase
MTAKLVVVSGPDKGRSFPLPAAGTLSIGRSDTTTTKLSDTTVSRVHCEIEVGPQQTLLHNASSRGTEVNGKAVGEQPWALKPGDLIRLGGTELQYTIEVSPADADPRKLIGKRLEEYQVESVLAEGRTGIIFRAKDLTANERPIALKIMLPEFASSDEDVQRFVRAMKTMIPVRHSHLVSIHGAGKTGPYCWIAMEFVTGQNLLQHAEQAGGTLPWKDVARIAIHIGRALQAAHELSIVHRNVTPANILIRSLDKLAKLGDLMLAKALEGRLAQHVTNPGELLGEMPYMSPERTYGADQTSERSDLYSLGASLYAVLVGHPPCGGDSLPDIIRVIRNVEPVPPRQKKPDMPEAFEKIVLKLLAKNPNDRYPTAKALLGDLDLVATAHGISAYF